MRQTDKIKSLIVQKYGGATVSDPEKIRQVAIRIAKLHQQGKKVVVVVSAMGKSTNQLIELAQQVSKHPNRRELDMLLSTGERVSMALLSIALNDLGCSAISFTGSQAGILTDDSHVAANVIDINAPRVHEALKQNKVVVLAGFQGVSPKTKEITTLGRGGSDITAIAMATHLMAERCEILKDVESVFSADPKIISNAKPIQAVTYPQLLDMTFWGAQFLNYRAVELAAQYQIPLYIGPATKTNAQGTRVNLSKATDKKNAKTTAILAINSHEQILKVKSTLPNKQQFIKKLADVLTQHEIPLPQILNLVQKQKEIIAYITAPTEQMSAIVSALKKNKDIQMTHKELSSVTCTYVQKTSEQLLKNIKKEIEKEKITAENTLRQNQSITVFVSQQQRQQTIQALHQLIH